MTHPILHRLGGSCGPKAHVNRGLHPEGLVHSLTGTAANVHHLSKADSLLHDRKPIPLPMPGFAELKDESAETDVGIWRRCA